MTIAIETPSRPSLRYRTRTETPARVTRPYVRHVIAAFALLGVFALCMWMYNAHNQFPVRYHPDEGGKAYQILSTDENWNFNHPLLLLETTHWATHWFETPDDAQAVVVMGRRVSALLAALGVIAIALSGYLAAGLPGLIGVAPVAALCPFLLAHTHAMKEDASLIFGIAFTVLGSRLLWNWGKHPILCWPATIVFAFGVAASASAKYVGLTSIALAVPVLAFAPHKRLIWSMLRVPVFLSFAIGFTLLINHRVIENFDHFTQGLEEEYEHGTTSHGGLTMDPFNTFVLDMTRDQTFPHVIAAAAVGLVLTLFWWRGKLGWDVCIWILGAVYLYVLCQNRIPMPRYALPTVVLLATVAGLGTVRLGQFIGRPWAVWGVPVLFATITIAWQGPRCFDYVHQFATDSRQQLREFLLTDKMRGAEILADYYASIDAGPYNGGDDGLRSRVDIRTMYSVGDAGPFDQLKRSGITHVIIADMSYNRYFDPHVHPTEEFAQRYDNIRKFYEDLRRDGQLVWSCEAEHPMLSFANPRLRVYRIIP